MAQEMVVICSSQLPISRMLLKNCPSVSSVECHDHEYEDCFMLAMSDPETFWKSRMSEEDFTEYVRKKEFNFIKEDFEDLDENLYIHNDNYRNSTLNMIYERKVDMIKNLD